MGTRNLIAVWADNVYKVAQYSQWDGYPSGQGAGVLQFLKNEMKDDFKEKVRACKFISSEEAEERYNSVKDDSSFSKIYPELSRDTGSDILSLIQNSEKAMELIDKSDFGFDSLFCEYAYVVNLDDNTLECYKGFNQEPLHFSERFFQPQPSTPGQDYQYYGAKLVKVYDFSDLPDESTFCSDIDPFEEEEE